MAEYQPKTGAECSCKRGVQRDNCQNCEGTGWVIDFAAIRARRAGRVIELLGRMGGEQERTFVRDGSGLGALKLCHDRSEAMRFTTHNSASLWGQDHLQGHQWQIVS